MSYHCCPRYLKQIELLPMKKVVSEVIFKIVPQYAVQDQTKAKVV